MDALESVFVPYRDVLAPKAPVARPSASPWRWLWIGVMLVIVGVGLWMASRGKGSPSLQWMSDNSVWSPQAAVQKAVLPSKAVDFSAQAATAAAGPSLASIPKSIALIRGGSGPATASTPQELAKQVGLAVKQTLLTFPTLSPEIVASVVQHTVRSILAAPRDSEAAPAKAAPVTRLVPVAKAPAPQPPPARPTGGRVQLQGLAIPTVDDDDMSPQEGGSKQKKINADTDPAIMRLMKERGIEVKD